MIKLQGKLPKNIILACSGGVDSMAALDFLSRRHCVRVVYVNHGTEHSRRAEIFLREYCWQRDILFDKFDINTKKPFKGLSQEEHWRNERYKIIDRVTRLCSIPAVTCHHLDDCVETWLWSSLHGNGKIIPYRRGDVVRPFRLTEKRNFRMWAEMNNVPWVEDDSNSDTCYTRNYIRHELMPHALRVNPGLHKVVKKKVLNDDYQALSCV
jgi:tRNA(Ile)-lysidine synthetase-like protein